MPLPSNAEIQRRMREFKEPTYGYRKGEGGELESELFDGEPPKGWWDSPERIGEPQADEDGFVDPGRSLELPYEDHLFNALRTELKTRQGKGPPQGTDRDEVIEMLEALDAAPEEEDE